MNIVIKGVIVFDTNAQENKFLGYLKPDDFGEDRVSLHFPEYVLVCSHTIHVVMPDVDMIGPQIAALNAKERELTAKYQAAKTVSEAQRRTLLALEMS